MQQKSIYGTPGYAPPEQYTGQVEPRSDVYALAATLYHLVSDDEPGPACAFPHLDRLDQLGALLRSALQKNVAERPSAARLREQLTVLAGQIERNNSAQPASAPLQPARTSPRSPVVPPKVRAPDGDIIDGPDAFLRWAEQQWHVAKNWLYDDTTLPAQIRGAWRNDQLADSITLLLNKYSTDHDAGLDAILAVIDPGGFGAEQPQIGIAQQSKIIAFPHLSLRTSSSAHLLLKNTSRRYIDLRIETPDWLSASPAMLPIIPGQEAQITFNTDLGSILPQWRFKQHIRLYYDDHPLGIVTTHATVSLVEQIRWRFGKRTKLTP